jgi:protein TonB
VTLVWSLRLDNMDRTDGIIWSTAVALSLLIHATLLINRSSELSIAIEDNHSDQIVTQVSFRIPTPLPEKPVEVKPEIPKPQPVVEIPEPRPKPKPVKKIASKIKPPDEVAEEIKEPIKQAPTPTTQIVEEELPKTLQISRTEVTPQIIEQARQSYLARLLAHIESNKHYPKAARRRRIEGESQVSFRLLAKGQIEALEVTGEREVLQKATHSAVMASLPMPNPPQELDLPLVINFTMAFVLK